MNRIAFVFPGQGAQYVGMGKELAEQYESVNEVFDKANESLGFDIKKLCFEGPMEELTITENTQPAILTTSIAVLRAVEEIGIKGDITAGLSLGEYSALVYADALSFEDAVRLVRKRGKYMQEAVPVGKGTMAAIIGLERDILKNVIDEARTEGVVEEANINCPGQIVISGEIKAIERACKIAKEKSAKKAVVLPVSAPFHCSLLKPAGTKLNEELKDINIRKMSKKVISNVTGDYIDNEEQIKELLVQQVSKPVLWQDTIELMINDGIDTFIEIGPGKTLTSFIKKISRKMGKKVKCHNVEDVSSLIKLKQEIG